MHAHAKLGGPGHAPPPPPPPPLENVDIWGLRSLASGAISAQSVLSMPDISIIIITCSVKCAAACRLYFDRARVS